MLNLLSETAISCLFTKGITAKSDKRQRVRKSYSVPDEATRKLLAQLILEEALETVAALGFGLYTSDNAKVYRHESLQWVPEEKPDLMKIVDGCCDTIYVATGALVACGVPDIPHMEEVCACNDDKFPDGVAKIDPETGKYLKPLGWQPPNHEEVRKRCKSLVDMKAITQQTIGRNG